jgi:hypothetical protein
MLAKNAVQNPDTRKPGTSVDTSSIMSALMTSKKSPNVMRVKGMVRTITTGLITALAKPSSNADRKSDFLLVKEIPWKTRLTTHRDKAVIPQ